MSLGKAGHVHVQPKHHQRVLWNIKIQNKNKIGGVPGKIATVFEPA